jgi:GMP synthase (glutamine-hydrolysing)
MRTYDSRVSKPILVLRAGDPAPVVAEARGLYPAWIRATVADEWCGPWSEHDVRTDAPLPPLDSVAALVITGSSHSVTERAPWMLALEAYARDANAQKIPLLGICFGHQIVAQALGGHVEKNPRGREIGTVRVRLTASDAIFASIPDTFDVNATHVDTVSRLPPGARLLAGSDIDPTQAFAIGETTRCVQFHPEFDGDVMRRYLIARASLVESEGGDPTRLEARDAPHGAQVLRNFVRHIVRAEG